MTHLLSPRSVLAPPICVALCLSSGQAWAAESETGLQVAPIQRAAPKEPHLTADRGTGIKIRVTDAPKGKRVKVRVRGMGIDRTIRATSTLRKLKPGRYRITAESFKDKRGGLRVPTISDKVVKVSKNEIEDVEVSFYGVRASNTVVAKKVHTRHFETRQDGGSKSYLVGLRGTQFRVGRVVVVEPSPKAPKGAIIKLTKKVAAPRASSGSGVTHFAALPAGLKDAVKQMKFSVRETPEAWTWNANGTESMTCTSGGPVGVTADVTANFSIGFTGNYSSWHPSKDYIEVDVSGGVWGSAGLTVGGQSNCTLPSTPIGQAKTWAPTTIDLLGMKIMLTPTMQFNLQGAVVTDAAFIGQDGLSATFNLAESAASVRVGIPNFPDPIPVMTKSYLPPTKQYTPTFGIPTGKANANVNVGPTVTVTVADSTEAEDAIATANLTAGLELKASTVPGPGSYTLDGYGLLTVGVQGEGHFAPDHFTDQLFYETYPLSAGPLSNP